MNRIYNAKLSTFSIVTTLILNVLLLAICYVFLFETGLLKMLNQQPENLKYLMVFFLIAILVITYLLHPQKYYLGTTFIGIKKPLYLKKLLLEDASEVRQVEYKELSVRFRLFGSGGAWGYFGLFYSSQLGVLRMNVSNIKDLVMIRMKDNKIYIISPENSANFVEKVNHLKKA